MKSTATMMILIGALAGSCWASAGGPSPVPQAATTNSPERQLLVAAAALRGGDYPLALKIFTEMAERGDARAQFNLGKMYSEGKGVPKDVAQAVTWYRKAAEQGYAKAQYELGELYHYGRRVPKDEAQAVTWYRKAAEQGYDLAQFQLGLLYSVGIGVPKDEAQAVTWYRKAAEQRHAASQFQLGIMYRNGRGVPQDHVQAAKWFYMAKANGSIHADSAISEIEQKMSRQQIEQARALAAPRQQSHRR